MSVLRCCGYRLERARAFHTYDFNVKCLACVVQCFLSEYVSYLSAGVCYRVTCRHRRCVCMLWECVRRSMCENVSNSSPCGASGIPAVSPPSTLETHSHMYTQPGCGCPLLKIPVPYVLLCAPMSLCPRAAEAWASRAGWSARLE